MSKNNTEQLMKFKVEDNKLKMEIKINDLIWLFKTSSENFDGESQIAKVKKDKKDEFIKYIIDYLREPYLNDENIVNWAAPFEDCFIKILEGYEDFCKYKD